MDDPLKQRTPIETAMMTLMQVMQSDPAYAWSWHYNIAMSMVDAGCDQKTANAGAAHFMQIAFAVDTSKAPGR